MKTGILCCLLMCLIGALSLAELSPEKPTKADVIAKARQMLERNHYVRFILDANKGKDFLNPENKFYSNSVVVSDDLRDVRFSHNGNPYDSDSIFFTVKLDKNLSLAEINIRITPGGHE